MLDPACFSACQMILEAPSVFELCESHGSNRQICMQASLQSLLGMLKQHCLQSRFVQHIIEIDFSKHPIILAVYPYFEAEMPYSAT